MQIINPLYDKAFKYLMENNKLAKKVLSVILDVEIEDLILGQQEAHVVSETRQLSLFRLDFKATIKQADGSRKTVLIELQKSKLPTDIRRFRNYLGANYITQDPDASASGAYDNIVKEPPIEYGNGGNVFPIITIYILGYNLDDLPYMAVSVNRELINSVSKERIETQCFFVDHLTHESHIIQVRRLPEKRRTRLEQFLTLFNQAWITQKSYILDLQEIPEEFQDVANYLHVPIADEQFRKQLEGEQEIDYIFDTQEAKFLKKIEEAEKQREEEKRLREQAEMLRKKIEKEKEDTHIKLKKAIQRMLSKGFSLSEIAEDLEIPETEVEDLLR